MEPIDEKIKEAWQDRDNAYTYEDAWAILRDAYVHERAMRERAEWMLRHKEMEHADSRAGSRRYVCLACNYDDPRHEWRTDADWEARVREELEEEK